MAVKVDSPFQRYKISHREELSGKILTLDQKIVIQNDLALVAEQILGLVYMPQDPLEFVKQDAFLKGQMSVYRVLLDASDECERELLSTAQIPQDDTNVSY